MTMLPPDPIYIFQGEMEPISCVAFKITDSEGCLYAGTQAGVVHVWDLKSKREAATIKIGQDSCLSINFTEEDTVITQDKSGLVSLWSDETIKWSLLKTIQTDFFGFCKASLHQNIIYTALKDARCHLISANEFETIKILNLSDDSKLGEIMAFRVKIINDQKVMLVTYEAQKLIIWNLEKELKMSELSIDGCPMALDFDVHTNKGIVGDSTNKMVVFSLSKDLDIMVTKEVCLINAGVASIKIRPDSKLVAVGCWDGKLRLYSWKSLVVLAVLESHSSTIQDVCFSEGYRDGGKFKCLLAAASQDCQISLWDLYN